MKLQNRIEILQRLKNYLLENPEELQEVVSKAIVQNGWFTQEFITLAIKGIVDQFLDEEKLNSWTSYYHLNDAINAKNVGIVMAGNIPLVGFHDFLSVFICGHAQTIKLSSKDDILLKHFVQKMYGWEVTMQNFVSFASRLADCDAYIATGSNNSAGYFDYYFSKYPSIIRRNRTSVAILKGTESKEELEKLSVDVHSYFGLGCRNVTKIFVPIGYDFIPLLASFNGYKHFEDHHAILAHWYNLLLNHIHIHCHAYQFLSCQYFHQMVDYYYQCF